MTFTRTIKVFTYTTGKFNPATMTVDGIQSHSFIEELGKRALSKLAAEFGPVLNVTTTDVLLEIDATDFVKYSHIIEKDGEKVSGREEATSIAKTLGLHTRDNVVE